MKVVFLKKNEFISYKKNSFNGYTFKPRNKNIKSLLIIKEEFIRYILSKKIKREISKIKKTVILIVNSNVSIVTDCDMMLNEIVRISQKLEEKYRLYFNEFEYFENVKELYVLNNVINYKKKLLSVKV